MFLIKSNKCADSLAILWLSLMQPQIWNMIPQATRESFNLDRLGKANYRFTNM
jgi:hypothetical protein